MFFWKKLITKPKKEVLSGLSPLEEDLKKAAQWAAANLTASGYRADFSLDSLKELDRFFETERTALLAEHEDRGIILFTLGAYYGEVAIRHYGGHWRADEAAEQVELYVWACLDNGQAFQPVQASLAHYRRADGHPLHAQLLGLIHEASHRVQLTDDQVSSELPGAVSDSEPSQADEEV